MTEERRKISEAIRKSVYNVLMTAGPEEWENNRSTLYTTQLLVPTSVIAHLEHYRKSLGLPQKLFDAAIRLVFREIIIDGLAIYVSKQKGETNETDKVSDRRVQ